MAGVDRSSELVLRKPDTVLPRFATPESSAPQFLIPELPRLPKETFCQPELLAPTLPKPEELPVPLLKNPDDGKVVELKKPGAAAILMRVMSTGSVRRCRRC
ncbi:hypothetical protein MSHI_00010 [Mycobacterium shinjukuense]|uniref:Uncharacterized protein n=1 Tax=Mycobacterium shinjukuense TaxID=398694 RepID=A0A7I7MIW9_9MYCO|nr:hypothetical protein MSHI_00010 [Mycobacterium shinjukuense]